jgi:protein transport protein SEC23
MEGHTWDVASSEEMSGTRLSFHCWPSSRLEATRSVAPFGALYTPLKKLPPSCAPPTALPYDPIRCSTPSCHAVLNPYCQVDFRSKLWVCPFCLTRNHFPPHYVSLIYTTQLHESYLAALVTTFNVCPHCTSPLLFTRCVLTAGGQYNRDQSACRTDSSVRYLRV